MTSRSEVLKKLESMGISAKKSLGQNFLVSDIVIEKIIEQVQTTPTETVVEIGPGLGALTDHLCAEPLELIELDRVFAEYWRGKGLTVHEIDALKFDWSTVKKDSVGLVSNLPYQISASLVIDRSGDWPKFQYMVLMFQKEVAQRITAQPKTNEYGLLSVIAQSAWKISKVCDAGRGCFYPPPKVESRVLRFDPLPEPLPQGFLPFAKHCFAHRRKKLRGNLCRSGLVTDEESHQIWGELSLAEGLRAQELSVEEFHILFDQIKKFQQN